MAYMIDTGIFRKLLDHFPKQGKLFQEVWEKLDQGIKAGNFISVDECYNELVRHYDEKNPNYVWLHERRFMFQNPTNEESICIKNLFLSAKMRESIHKRNIVENRPSADSYLVAKAKRLGAVIVTTETYKPASAQLPNICEVLGVECISYDDFMEILST